MTQAAPGRVFLCCICREDVGPGCEFQLPANDMWPEVQVGPPICIKCFRRAARGKARIPESDLAAWCTRCKSRGVPAKLFLRAWLVSAVKGKVLT